eukprot:1299774-Pleurochrysis_carterae.AAC.5
MEPLTVLRAFSKSSAPQSRSHGRTTAAPPHCRSAVLSFPVQHSVPSTLSLARARARMVRLTCASAARTLKEDARMNVCTHTRTPSRKLS